MIKERHETPENQKEVIFSKTIRNHSTSLTQTTREGRGNLPSLRTPGRGFTDKRDAFCFHMRSQYNTENSNRITSTVEHTCPCAKGQDIIFPINENISDKLALQIEAHVHTESMLSVNSKRGTRLH